MHFVAAIHGITGFVWFRFGCGLLGSGFWVLDSVLWTLGFGIRCWLKHHMDDLSAQRDSPVCHVKRFVYKMSALFPILLTKSAKKKQDEQQEHKG